jgi:hypothetical protein
MSLPHPLTSNPGSPCSLRLLPQTNPQRFLPKSCPSTATSLRPRHDAPGADDVVGVAGEEGLAVGAPGEGDALGLAGLLADLELGLELINLALLLKVEDDDAAGSGSAEPVAVGGEDKGVDLVVGVERVQVLALIKIPQHGGTILAARSAQRSIGRDSDSVDVAGVTNVVSLKLAGRELPDLTERTSQRCQVPTKLTLKKQWVRPVSLSAR